MLSSLRIVDSHEAEEELKAHKKARKKEKKKLKKVGATWLSSLRRRACSSLFTCGAQALSLHGRHSTGCGQTVASLLTLSMCE